MNIAGEIRLPYVNIKYEEPVVYFVYKEGTELGFPEIRQLISCAESLSEGKPYFTFADARVSMNVTIEGKRIMEDPKTCLFFVVVLFLLKMDFTVSLPIF